MIIIIDDGKQIMLNGRNIGFLAKDIFVTHRIKREHLFRLYNGYGISEDILMGLIDANCKEIRLIERDEDSEKVYITTPHDWQLKGIPCQYIGFERQLILPLKDFNDVIG